MSFGGWDLATVAAKAASYAATFGASGGVFYLLYSHAFLADQDRLAIRRLVRLLIFMAVFAGAAQIALTAGSMSGELSALLDPGLLGMVWHAGEGRALLVRTAGLLLAVPALMNRPGRQRGASISAIAGACGAATSFAWIGHVRELASVWPTLLIGIHLLGVAFWVGAFGPLLLVLRDREPRRAAAAVARFGAAAVFVVGALIAAGLPLLFMMLGGVSSLWSSSYGRCFIAKLGLVACLLCVAAFNKLRLTPRLKANDAAAARCLRRSIGAEMALAACILVVTAIFTTLTGPPAR